jgi:N6-L-threonylcarbamoyladenine synthase
MKILAIDTSCDETACAITSKNKILSNIIWSQASLHSRFGGVLPSLAQRAHSERIDFVINKALKTAKCQVKDIQAIAVTAGPGLAIALGVGISKAKDLAKKLKIPLIAVNHLEAHVLSPLAVSKNYSAPDIEIRYPALGLVISGGNSLFVEIESIGKYKVLATTIDDALGEALDKAARMLGLGYPGGGVLEEMAKKGVPSAYELPIPIKGFEKKQFFTYSGLKTAFSRLVEKEKQKHSGELTKKQIQDLAACFQDTAFQHLTRIMTFIIKNRNISNTDLLVGGGVSANNEVRKRIRVVSKQFGLKPHFPYTKKLCGDNAAMIGITAYFRMIKQGITNHDIDQIDRDPNAKIDKPFKWNYNL